MCIYKDATIQHNLSFLRLLKPLEFCHGSLTLYSHSGSYINICAYICVHIHVMFNLIFVDWNKLTYVCFSLKCQSRNSWHIVITKSF